MEKIVKERRKKEERFGFEESFETPLKIISGLQNVVEFKYLFSTEAVNNKCYVKHIFWKVFQKLSETIKESISSNVQVFFTLKELDGTQKEL